MFRRVLDLAAAARRKSLLLLGPRLTGKSTLLRQQFPGAVVVDLLHSATYRLLAGHAERLEEMVRALPEGQRLLVVDEVQKLPELLDEVHRLIELMPDARFILTGSSARKLRRSGTNLLGGRARRALLWPLVHPERQTDAAVPVSLERVLSFGNLPAILRSPNPREDLLDYIGVYLQEEIKAEAAVRGHERFVRFLEVAAAANGEQTVFANISRDAEVPARTVRNFFEVLEDTLVGRLVLPYRGTSVRKAVATAKFYFFDVGLANALVGRTSVSFGSPEYGRALEHLVFQELSAFISYSRSEAVLSYWRSESGFEVDFVLVLHGEAVLGVEVKAATAVTSRDCRGLVALGEETPAMRRVVVSQEPFARRLDGEITVMPVVAFLDALWKGQLLAIDPTVSMLSPKEG